MVAENTSYESFYTGGYSSLNPDYGNFVGYRMDAANLGFPGSPQTANQVTETVNAIKQGVKAFEVTMLQPDVAEQIPKQHFQEMRALMKLTGVKPSVHGPIIDAAGFGEKGQWGGDLAREDSERRLFSTVEKAHELDPEGNIPVVIHSSGGIPGAEWRPGEKPGEFKEQALIAIDQETGQLATQLKEERKFYPRLGKEGLKEGELRKPREEMNSLNESDWDNKLTNLAFYKKHADEIIGDSPTVLEEFIGKRMTEGMQEKMTPSQLEAAKKMGDAHIFLDNVRLNFNAAFDKAWKYGNEEQKKELGMLSDEYSQKIKKMNGGLGQPLLERELLENAITKLRNITSPQDREDKIHKAPQLYKPVEDFAMDKAAKTFGNLAFKSYDKFGKNSPVIAVENMMQGMAFSRAEDMGKLVGKAKDVFVEKAQAEGVSKSEAKKQADKLLGVTWDVGHLNMMRKAGFKEEDVIKETEKIAPLVKHVHITDNFGYSDSHLPPGMGNVPFKQILEKLEKQGKLGEMRKIVEAGAFVQHFKKSPHPWTLSAFGSPIYGAKMAPYWNQVAETWGGYFGFPLAYLPEKHFSTYGSGFSSLPEELGGQMPGTQSRFSGTSNA